MLKILTLAIGFIFTTFLSKAQIKLEPISEQVVESQRLHVFKALKYIGNNTALMVSKGTCYKVDLTSGKETPIATGFKPKVDYFPMSADGKYFLELNFELKNIVKSDGKKLILVADIDAELGKAGYPVLPFVCD